MRGSSQNLRRLWLIVKIKPNEDILKIVRLRSLSYCFTETTSNFRSNPDQTKPNPRHSENSKYLLCEVSLSLRRLWLIVKIKHTQDIRKIVRLRSLSHCFTETSSNFRSNPEQNTRDIQRTASICCARYRSKSLQALTNSQNQNYSRTKCLWCGLKIFAATSKLKLLTEYVEREVMQ